MFETIRTAMLTGGLGLMFVAAGGCGDSGADGTGGTTSASTGTTSTSATSTSTASTGTGGAMPVEYAAVVRGTLASSDLAQAKATHDQIASGAEAQAKAAGDHAHDVLLGTMLLDSVPNQFLAIDRWDDAAAMQAFYADPQVQQAFGSLFSQPPTIEYFTYHPDWVSWGDMTSGDAFDPYYFHFAIGTLKDTDTAKNKTYHDMVASGGKQPSIDAGNVAHVVFLGLTDERQFLAVDIWKSDTNIEAFYTNPQFVMAFAPLFESVSQPVFVSTDWHQW
jgi:quinol monooxygenase YgiN